MRISVTHLDSYLYWLSSDMELDQLLARIKGEEPPGPSALAGRAFHSLLENAEPGQEFGGLNSPIVDGHQFVFAIEEELALPPVRELKAEEVFQTPSGPVTLVGKVDALNGLTVQDYKLTERFDAEKYMESLQWRAYLTMFDAWRFVYDVFVARYDVAPSELTQVVIYDYHRLPLCAYPGMRADVERAVAGLAEIIATHLPERVAA